MSQAAKQMSVARGEFVRVLSTTSCPYSKPTHEGPAIDGLVHWRSDDAATAWLAGDSTGLPEGKAATAIFGRWRDDLAAALKRTPHHVADGQCGIGNLTLCLHSGWLELSVPLPPPAASGRVLAAWRLAVNSKTHLVAVDEACTKATIFLPLIMPCEEDVEVIKMALSYVQLELWSILECLCSQAEVAAAWEGWVLETLPDENDERR